MRINRVRPILLLCAYLLPINEVGVCTWHHVRREDVSSSLNWPILAFLEAHGHRGHNAMRMIVHLEDLLLLSR